MGKVFGLRALRRRRPTRVLEDQTERSRLPALEQEVDTQHLSRECSRKTRRARAVLALRKTTGGAGRSGAVAQIPCEPAEFAAQIPEGHHRGREDVGGERREGRI